MAAPTYTVSPSTHDYSDTLLLFGGPFGSSQGNSFVYVIDDQKVIWQMTVVSWSNTTVEVQYPSEFLNALPNRDYTESVRVFVAGESEPGATNATYKGVGAALDEIVGGPIYVAEGDVRVEQQSYSRGYALGAESDGYYQVKLLQPDNTYKTTVVESDKLTAVGALSFAYLGKQQKLPAVPMQLLWTSQTQIETEPLPEGNSIPINVTVSWWTLEIIEPSPGAPTGKVTFFIDGEQVAEIELTPSGAYAATANHSASLTEGTYTATVSYEGNDEYGPSFAVATLTVGPPE